MLWAAKGVEHAMFAAQARRCYPVDHSPCFSCFLFISVPSDTLVAS